MAGRRKQKHSKKRYVSAAQRAINEWRGIAEPAEGMRNGRPIADLVPEAMNRLRMRTTFTEEEICAAWEEIVGPVLAPHTHPSGLRRGVLLVSVVQPTVHYTIQGMKKMLLERLQERFGAVRVQDLRFRMG
jgi:predicted nucleic acid-binding Zn ribbon protein